MPEPKMTPEAQAAYDEALTRIEACYREENNGTFLDLAGFGLTVLPPEIGQLSALTKLFLFRNELTTLPPEIGKLAALKELHIDSNQLVMLPSEIGHLTALTRLSCAQNKLATLPPEIGHLMRLTHINLENNQLTALPPEIGHLLGLTLLHLSRNRLTTLPPEIGQLAALRTLRLSSNRLTTLPAEIGWLDALTHLGLFDNRLTTLPPEIGLLTHLEGLDLAHNQLMAMPSEAGQLAALTDLNLFGNRFTTVPLEIGKLARLSHLSLSHNQLTALPPEIGNVTTLVGLNLAHNQLTTLPPEIGRLTGLESLDLALNQLTMLSSELSKLTRLRTLYLHENPGLGLPAEILGATWQMVTADKVSPASPRAILDYYFETRGDQGRALREVKLIFVGRGEVGKSSLVDVLQGKLFVKQRGRTDGISITPWDVELPDGSATLKLWDFGGQEIMHGTHQFFLTHRSLYVVMVDGRHDRSKQDAEYWLKLVRAFGGESPVLVVMNRQNSHPFDLDRQHLADKYGVALDQFFRTDCEDASTIQQLEKTILREAAQILAQEERFPVRCWDIKERLAEMKKHGDDYLSDERYAQLCIEHGLKEPEAQQKLLRRLADLGTVVSFPDDVKLAELSVLNPEWATDGIYRIITHAVLREQRHGQLAGSLLRTLLPKDRWPKQQHLRYMLDLMEKFELCFPVHDAKDTMLVPELLPDRTPALVDWDASQCVVFQYRYPVLPHGVLPRFITRTHELSEDRERWRTGVVLSHDGADALIKADYEASLVSVWVRGDHMDARRALLKVVRLQFEHIHARIKELNPEEHVAVPGHPEVLVPYLDVLMDERRGKTTFPVTVDKQRTDWPISELLNGVESAAERHQAAEVAREHPLGTIINHNYGDKIQGDQIMSKDDHSRHITIHGNVTNAQVGQTLTNCTNMIQTAEGVGKDLLEALQREVQSLIKALPEDKRAEVACDLELAVKGATSSPPVRKWYSLSADGLIEASKFAKDFTGNITGTVGQIGKLLWPDFKLPGGE